MIQSVNFESKNMKIKKILNNIGNFVIKRFIELFGLLLASFSILLFISLTSYSPEDPNFIFSDQTEINNLMGFRGSYASDLLYQSFGLTALLIPITILITGINIIRLKEFFLFLRNFFYMFIYIIFGSYFFTTFYQQSFNLTINGNGGFVGNYLFDRLNLTQKIIENNFFYFGLVFLILFFFLISINFKISTIKKFSNVIKNFFKRKESNNELTNKNYDINKDENYSTVKSEREVQADLPFNKYSKNELDKKFKLPKVDILNKPVETSKSKKDNQSINEAFLEKILLDFGVEGMIKKVNYGPVVTLNEFEPAAGVKVSKIINLSEDIARSTKSDSARISMIPGSNTIGIEIPNLTRENVYLREIISNQNFSRKENKLPIALGKSISGVPIVGDLTAMPHLLIAGTTGSGKSVCINTIILSLLYKHTPDKCKFILIDPKMLELSVYEGIPHLLCPVITEAKKAASVLGWIVKEMESRYRLMTKEGVRNIDGYNSKHKLPMPYIVVIVDEMSDLMHVAGKEIEGYIQKLSQMARASGIHIIMATQRPSVDVITGTIKANFPTRISFQVSSKIDSRTILGEQGAEQLLGKGDMLYMSSANRIVRIHAPFVSDDEIEKVNNFIKDQADPDYIDEILSFADERDRAKISSDDDNEDELYQKALDIVKLENKASTSFLQRKLQIGYNRAARIVDMMEERGEISKPNHVGKRDIIK